MSEVKGMQTTILLVIINRPGVWSFIELILMLRNMRLLGHLTGFTICSFSTLAQTMRWSPACRCKCLCISTLTFSHCGGWAALWCSTWRWALLSPLLGPGSSGPRWRFSSPLLPCACYLTKDLGSMFCHFFLVFSLAWLLQVHCDHCHRPCDLDGSYPAVPRLHGEPAGEGELSPPPGLC